MGEYARVRGSELVNAWGDFLGRIPWEVFFTLTFDPQRIFPVGEKRAGREAAWWVGHVACILRRPIGWAYVVERGRGGMWHAHMLIVGAGRSSWGAAISAWEARNGHAHVGEVWRSPGIAMYTSKDVRHGGEVVLSDTSTLERYRNALKPMVLVPLHAELSVSKPMSPADAAGHQEPPRRNDRPTTESLARNRTGN